MSYLFSLFLYSRGTFGTLGLSKKLAKNGVRSVGHGKMVLLSDLHGAAANEFAVGMLAIHQKSPAHEDVVRRALGCSGVGCVYSSFIAHLAKKLLLALAQMGGQLHIVSDDEVAIGAIGLLVTFAAKADLGPVLRFRFHF